MTSAPRILVPAARLGALSGKTVLLLIVELWVNQVTVRIAATPTWRDDPDPSAIPDEDDEQGTPELSRLRIYVSDDADTEYKITSGQTGGTDTEWRADWHFRPGVPTSAKRIVIHAVGDEEQVVELSLDRAPDSSKA